MAQIGGGIVASRLTGVLTDDGGNPILSTLTSAADPDEMALGAALWRYMTTGILNSDFAYGAIGALFSDEMAPTYWGWAVASGSSVTGFLADDVANGSGRVARMQLTAGSAGDEAYLEQIVKIISSANRAFSFTPYGFFTAEVTSADVEVFVSMQFLTRDLVATGSEQANELTTDFVGSGIEMGIGTPAARIPPADAYFARLRYGLRRSSGGSNSAVASVTLTETYMITGHPRVHFPDATSQDTYGVGVISQAAGHLQVDAATDLASSTDENAHVILRDRRVLAISFESAVVAGTTINPTGELVRLEASSPVTITAAPTVANGVDGQVIWLLNTGANAITIQDQGTLASSNLRLSTATFVMGTRDSIQLVYNSTIGDWVEVARTNVI